MADIVREMTVVISANASNLVRGAARAARSIGRFAMGPVRALTNAFAGLAAKGLALAGSLGSLATVGISLKLAAELEQTTVAFTTMLGSVEQAKKTIGDLRRFSDVTPFEPEPVIRAGRSLLAFGIETQKLIPTLTNLGNVAAGVGIPIGDIAEIYGKARVQGRLFAEDINQLTGRGIPVIGELAAQFGVAESEVKKLTEQGKINFQALEQAFQSLASEGGKFAGLMAAQSKTLIGLWSTFKGRVSALLTDVGKTIIETFDLKTVLANVTNALSTIATQFKEFASAVKPELGGLREFMAGFSMGASESAISVSGAFRAIAKAFVPIINLVNALRMAWEGFKAVLFTVVEVIALAVRATTRFANSLGALPDAAVAAADSFAASVDRMATAAKDRFVAGFDDIVTDKAIDDAFDRIDGRIAAAREAAAKAKKPEIAQSFDFSRIGAGAAGGDGASAGPVKAAEDAAKKAKELQDEMRSRAQQIAQSVRTPMEVLRDELREIQRLSGFLGPEMAGRAAEAARARFRSTQGGGAPQMRGIRRGFGGEAGSAAAADLIANALSGGQRGNDPIVKEQERTTEETRKSRKEFEKLRKEMLRRQFVELNQSTFPSS